MHPRRTILPPRRLLPGLAAIAALLLPLAFAPAAYAQAKATKKTNPLVESLTDDAPAEAEAEADTVEAAPEPKAAPAKSKTPAKRNPVVESLTDEEPAEAATEDSLAEETAEASGPDSSAAAAPADSAAGPALGVVEVERLALEQHPILAEKQLQVVKSEEQIRNLDMAVILPKFEIETGIGPAPGIRQRIDRGDVTVGGDTVLRREREFDFGEWGPFFGIEATVAQPLNIGRYRAGRKAATLQVRVSEAEFKKEQLIVSEEAQTLYYQRLYALTLARELTSARKDLDRAQKRLQNQLDAEEGNVSQTDLLQIKSGRYSLDQGYNEANLGVARSALGLGFLLNRSDSGGVTLADTGLSMRREAVPSLPDLKIAALRAHPDLLRLRNGLSARQELLKVAQGELGPDIFLFGNFKYSKAWSSDRQSGGDDPFARDPLNELTAVAGLGMRLRLNFWNGYQKYRKERLELRQLERTEVYAARGILLRVEDAYLQMAKARSDAEEAQKALRAAEAWLKGVAMKYDLNETGGTDIVAPFKQSLTAKRDYYKAVLEYNVAVAKLFTATGWTLSDYLGTLSK
jgi:outer membrane protein TolC